MSMIYECPNCHAPQAAGRISCRYCGAEFDSPVPGDAFVPDGTAAEPPSGPAIVAPSEPDPAEPVAPEAEAVGAAVCEAPVPHEYEAPVPHEAEPISQEAVVQEAVVQEAVVQEAVVQEAVVQEAEPPPSRPDTPPLGADAPPEALAETLPYQSPPYSAPAYHAAPTYADQADTVSPSPSVPQRPPLGKTLTRALLIAFPIVLVVVLGAVFFAHSLDSGQDTAPAPLPPIASAPTPAVTPTASGKPVAPPYVLNGTVATSGADDDPRTQRMVGRWESKKLDFYVFNENKTGTRGSLTGKGPQGVFLWALVQNHLILYGDKQEQLTYSKGPDEDTMFLRSAAGGKYIQYTRTKTEPARP